MSYSLATLSNEPAGGWPILMYHQVARPPIFSGGRGLFVSPRLFRRQMRELRDAGYRSASLTDARKADSSRRVIVTFDDGFASASAAALPILAEYGFSAIQFIVADRRTNQWDTELGGHPYWLMDNHQIRDWLAAGHEIGSHTLTHPHLTRLDPVSARREIFDSKASLEDRFQIPIRHFCYPYGDTNPIVRDFVVDAGYETACSTRPGTHQSTADPFLLHRWMPSHRHPWLAAWCPF